MPILWCISFSLCIRSVPVCSICSCYGYKLFKESGLILHFWMKKFLPLPSEIRLRIITGTCLASSFVLVTVLLQADGHFSSHFTEEAVLQDSWLSLGSLGSASPQKDLKSHLLSSCWQWNPRPQAKTWFSYSHEQFALYIPLSNSCLGIFLSFLQCLLCQYYTCFLIELTLPKISL